MRTEEILWGHVGIHCSTVLYLLRTVASGLHISSSAFPHLVNQSILHHFQQDRAMH